MANDWDNPMFMYGHRASSAPSFCKFFIIMTWYQYDIMITPFFIRMADEIPRAIESPRMLKS